MAKLDTENASNQQTPHDQNIANKEYCNLLNAHNDLMMTVGNKWLTVEDWMQEVRFQYRSHTHRLPDYNVVPSPERLLRDAEDKYKEYVKYLEATRRK